MFIRLLKAKEIKNDPFTAVDKVAEKKTSKVKLTSDQIEKIENEDLEKGSKLWHVRNYFMYSFYNAGIRFGDLRSLTWKNLVDGRLVYQMSKTGGQKSIKQLKYMTDILEFYRDPNNKYNEYIFPILNKKHDDPFELRKAIGSNNAQVNLALKKLAKKVGIEANLSFHISRQERVNFSTSIGRSSVSGQSQVLGW